MALVERLRRRRPFVDHLIRMQGHYGSVNASQQAGAVTYFAFLSVFPILALAVFVVGYLSTVISNADTTLVDAVSSVLPGLIGSGPGEISLDSVQGFAGLAGIIGLLGVLYAGLGWISALRTALTATFEKPETEQPNFVFGKLRDLATLAVIGFVLFASVGVTGFVSTGSGAILDLLGLGDELEWLVKLISALLGLLANSVLFFAMFKLLAQPHAPRLAIWQGALLGAVGFEVLKQASSYLLAGTRTQPAFQAFGISLILLVWINYFSRVVLYSAAFTHTSAAARRQRDEEADANDAAVSTPSSVLASASAAAGGSAAAPLQSVSGTSWTDKFVERIDAADPDDVGEASAEASRLAAEQQRQGARQRMLALGAAGSAAGVAALLALRRRNP